MPIRFMRAVPAALLFSSFAVAQSITTTLSLKPRVSMEELANNVLDPRSDHYNRPYEPEEIRLLAGPSDREYADLLAGLKAEGMKIVQESPTHLYVSLKGRREVYESLFATRIETNSRGLRTHMQQPSIPFHLNLVESVSGLDNSRRAHPHIRRAMRAMASPGGVTPATIKSIYGFTPLVRAGLSGKGQQIAIATYDGFRVQNVQSYYSLSAISPAPNVDQVKFNGTPQYDSGSAGETELDAEFSGMIAPGVAIHVFASATNDDAGELQLFTAILDDNRSKIVNYSWGSCEKLVTAQHRSAMTAVLARAIAQGVTIFVASGDSGSNSCNDGTTSADWPSTSQYITAVGGTTLSSKNNVFSETAWSGSGGGISSYIALPSWQKGLGAAFARRSYPDVAFNGDPNSGEAMYTGPEGKAGWEVIGGTSMSAPQWAGFLAMVHEARTKAGKGSLGFLNSALYAMSAGDRATAFHDITSGKNGAYSARAGWDAVTGFGSMHADVLLNYLKTL